MRYVKILEEGVCGGKVCCIKVSYQGKQYILKEMKESMNYGRDYILMDRCKHFFGLLDMNMRRIRSNQGQLKLNPEGKSYVNNVHIGDKNCIYCMMDYWSNEGDLGKNKHRLKDPFIVEECLKIRLFDGLFRSSDNILRNILINTEGELLSIDEGDMFGKRKCIFNHHDWCKKHIHHDVFEMMINDILDNGEEKLEEIQKIFIHYEFTNFSEFETRFRNYREIVLEEVN